MDEEGDRMVSVARASGLRGIILKRKNRVNPTTGSRNASTRESSKHKATKLLWSQPRKRSPNFTIVKTKKCNYRIIQRCP